MVISILCQQYLISIMEHLLDYISLIKLLSINRKMVNSRQFIRRLCFRSDKLIV